MIVKPKSQLDGQSIKNNTSQIQKSKAIAPKQRRVSQLAIRQQYSQAEKI